MKNKLRSLTVITLTFTVFLIMIPTVSAKSRLSYLTDFLFENQVDNEMFGTSYEETSYALEIIDSYDLYTIEGLFGSETKVDKDTFIENLETAVEGLFDDDIDIYNLYHLLQSLYHLNELETLDTNYRNQIHEYINETERISGGFAISNSSNNVNLVSTYFVYKIYNLLNEPVPHPYRHVNFILSCNNTDGGYGGNQTLSSTILTTYYAVYLINELNATVDNLIDKSATLNYFKSFYSADSDDEDNYGGYFPEEFTNFALLSSTYYCVRSINMINSTELNNMETIDWILKHQNAQDGGFIENLADSENAISSILASYHAFKVLEILNSLDSLDQDVFMVEFSYIILIIVLSVIGAIVVIIVYLWKKRKF